jgi:hypothetical protein
VLGGSTLVVVMAPPPPGCSQTMPLQAQGRAANMNYNCSTSDHHANKHDEGRRGGDPYPAESSETTAPTTLTHALKAGFWPTNGGSALETYYRCRSRAQGRPRRDDRQVLCGILWVMDTGSSWRDLPEEEFGPNSTAHGRYRKWCNEGLWSGIV